MYAQRNFRWDKRPQMNIYRSVKRFASQRHYSISEIERWCEFNQGTIATWKTHKPSYDKVVRVAVVLEVTVEQLNRGY